MVLSISHDLSILFKWCSFLVVNFKTNIEEPRCHRQELYLQPSFLVCLSSNQPDGSECGLEEYPESGVF